MSDIVKAAVWTRLVDAATDFVTGGRTKEQGQKLSDAAKSWAAIRDASVEKPGRVVGTRGNTLRSGVVVPFGSSKGKPIEEESDKSLLWLIKYAREAIANPEKARFVDSNQALLDACLSEGESRGLDTEPDAF